MARRVGIVGWVLMLVALVAGCKVVPHGAAVADVNPKGWSPQQSAKVAYENSDSVSLRTIVVVARVENNRQGEPLEVKVRVVAPDSLEATHRLCLCQTATSSAGGSFEELSARWVEDARLKCGEYKFEIAPLATEQGVWTVGVEILAEQE